MVSEWLPEVTRVMGTVERLIWGRDLVTEGNQGNVKELGQGNVQQVTFGSGV